MGLLFALFQVSGLKDAPLLRPMFRLSGLGFTVRASGQYLGAALQGSFCIWEPVEGPVALPRLDAVRYVQWPKC